MAATQIGHQAHLYAQDRAPRRLLADQVASLLSRLRSPAVPHDVDRLSGPTLAQLLPCLIRETRTRRD